MSMIALRAAFDDGDVSAARELLNADPSLTTILIEAPDIHVTSPLTYVGLARFSYARHDRTGELARVLMEAGADMDDETKNGSPLICAASHGDAHVVRVLLDAGADVELTDNPPGTALRLAAAYGYTEIVDPLLSRGARIHSIIEVAGAGDLDGWSIAELSDFDKACPAGGGRERKARRHTLLGAGAADGSSHRRQESDQLLQRLFV